MWRSVARYDPPMQRTRLPRRAPHDRRDPGPPGWFRYGSLLLICCPECGRAAVSGHAIRKNGHVRGRVVCPFRPCTSEGWVALVGWDGGRRPQQDRESLKAGMVEAIRLERSREVADKA